MDRLQRQQALQALLETITDRVYFQPPASVQMEYPCIVWQRDTVDTAFADNLPYNQEHRYQVTVIDRNGNSEIPERVAALPSCTFSRYFAVDGLNHDLYNLYF